MKRAAAYIFILVMLAGMSADAYAQNGSGGTQSIFSIGAGSRGIAMGGAFSAVCDDASALYYNPAALRQNSYSSVMFNHIQLFSGFSDANYDFAGLVYPTLNVGSVGVGLMTSGTGGIRQFDIYSRELEEISYRETQGILSYAFDLPWRRFGLLTLGTSVKILNQRVGDFSDTGTGLDVGFLYKLPRLDGFVIGCNLQDIIGAETKLVTEKDKVYRTIMIGGGYTYRFENSSSLMMGIQYDMPELDDGKIRVGAEYSYKQTMAVRVGYDGDQITAGVGVSWRGFGFDYGYINRDEAGSSHPVTLSYRIGASVEEKREEIDEAQTREAEERIQQVFANRVDEHIALAEQHRSEGNLEQALDELKIALEFDPSNTAAAETLIVVQGEIIEAQEERTRSAEKAALINQHFELGLGYYSSNEYLLARAEFQNVLDLDPDNEQAQDYLGRTEAKIVEQIALHRTRAGELEQQGQLAAALGEWSIVQMLDPESVEAKNSAERISRRMEELSRNYADANRRLEEIQLYESALERFRESDYQGTIEICNRILARNPNHSEARDLKNRSERRMAPLTDEEKEEIRRLYISGMKLFSEDNYAEAIKEWRKILEINPDNESVQKNIEEAEARLRKIGSAEGE
jgi:tetratricopeptide (TPR) repeat protein